MNAAEKAAIAAALAGLSKVSRLLEERMLGEAEVRRIVREEMASAKLSQTARRKRDRQ